MNCAMMNGMTSSVKGSASEDALFLHQMIPHHQNAVNMAKGKMGEHLCFLVFIVRRKLTVCHSFHVISSPQDWENRV